jgi:hypothetical protein
VSGVNVIVAGMYGPASRLDPPGQGAAWQRNMVLVTVMVPVTATVLGVVVLTNAGVMAEAVMVAIVSCPVSATV